MEKRIRSNRSLQSFPCFSHPCLLLMFFFFFFILQASQTAQAYKNYTVGDDVGWFDNQMVPKVNYQKWAAGKNFSLGDYLIFNTDKNHSVVQTYNTTIYRHCDFNDADSDDTVEWSAGEPSFDKGAVTVAVPLLKEGMTYFFSGNYEGEQCKNGQHFKINVTHGEGLPESLKSPSEQAPAPASPDDDNNVPDSTVPSNFDNPTGTGNVQATSAVGEKPGGLLGVILGLVVMWVVMLIG